MTPDELVAIQQRLGLSDSRMAKALGVTRQTWRNWRTGRAFPALARNALRWMLELRRVSPSNDNLPDRLRFMPALAAIVAAAIAAGDVA
jgi:transcriptional regulator with XRE-family HTH domain